MAQAGGSYNNPKDAAIIDRRAANSLYIVDLLLPKV